MDEQREFEGVSGVKSLRGYQQEAEKALYDYWSRPGAGNALIVLPTGSGKSLLLSSMVKSISEKWPGTRILILSHVKELLTQDYNELKEHWPEAPAGIFSAGIGRKELHAPILVAGIQSLAAHAHRLDPPPEIVFVDECHLIPRNDTTRYRQVLTVLKQMYPHLKVVGLSATPYRLDSGWLHIGDGAIFDQIVYDVPVQSLIDQGYLCNVTPKNGSVRVGVEGVRLSGGEFVQSELEAIALDGDTTAMAVSDLVDRARDRKKWLVFACGVKHAARIKEELTARGILSAIITGETPKAERYYLIETFKGKTLESLRALININVLSTGFNAPAIDCIADLYPTESAGRYVQRVGRGMRTSPSKLDCLYLDYAGNATRHGPIDAIDPDRKPYDGEGVPPAKECPECMTIIHAACRVCPICGHVFPENQIYINNRPVEAPVLKSQIEPIEYAVTYTDYAVHKKEGKKDSVKITYSHNMGSVSEWIFPETTTQWGDFFYRKLCKEMRLSEPYPRTAEDFVYRCDLRSATRIWTIPEGKYERVKRHEWGELRQEFKDEIPF